MRYRIHIFTVAVFACMCYSQESSTRWNAQPSPLCGWDSLGRLIDYPPLMIAAGIQGTVVLKVSIDTNGVADSAKVVYASAISMELAALEGINKVRWFPLYSAGRPRKSDIEIPIVFSLSGHGDPAFVSVERPSRRLKITATVDTASQTGIYIPRDLSDCFRQLDMMLSSKSVQLFRMLEENETVLYHHSIGTWVRNNWGLWKGDTLARWFNVNGIFHPDDMSSIILQSYWRVLNNKPINLEDQIKHYQKFWEETKSGR